MAFTLKSVFSVPKLSSTFSSRYGGKVRSSSTCSFLSSDFLGKSISLSEEKGLRYCIPKAPRDVSNIHAQATICVSKGLRWWKKNPKPNMIEIHSAQELVHYLLNAGDSLVVVDFYLPGCGGCKALHPKICQIAEQYPKVIFLKANYEELRTMCHTLHIHVLPFFRFYRGAEGRVCSFSCTNATIKKFKDALDKHGNERCSLGAAKGLDESELEDLASIGEISSSIDQSHNSLLYPKDLALQINNPFSNVWRMASDRKKGLMEDIIY